MKGRFKRIGSAICVVLVFMLCIGTMPITALATENSETTENSEDVFLEEDTEGIILVPEPEDDINGPESVPVEESEETSETPAAFTYNPQPQTKADVQSAITAWQSGAAKARWEYQVSASLMPDDWRCDYLTDESTGAVYWSFFPAIAARTITEAKIYDSTNTLVHTDFLTGAIAYVNANPTNPYTIIIDEDITLTANQTITNTAGVTIKSDMSAVGAPFTITRASGRHFILSGGVSGGVSLTIENVILDGGTVYSGGTVAVAGGGGVQLTTSVSSNSCSFIMDSGSVIQNCYNASSGAAVLVRRYNNFTMNPGAVIRDCWNNSLDIVSIGYLSTFDMYGGTITGNRGGNTGGVAVDGGTFNMYDGEISYNSGSLGGGVRITGVNSSGTLYTGTVTMYGGEITHNTASSQGGGVYLEGDYTSFTMISGEISDNTAGSRGGGISLFGTVFGNGILIIGDPLNTGNPVIKDNIVNSGYGGGIFGASATPFIMYNGEISDNTANTTTTTGIGGGVYWSGTFNMESGKVNNNTAANNGGGVYMSGTFNMMDGEVNNNTANAVGGVFLGSGTFNMGGPLTAASVNPTVSGNAAATNYGGVYITGTNGAFNMYNGEINDNVADAVGGVGVYHTSGTGTFTMYDGEINSNVSASSIGGGVYLSGASVVFTMKDGKINGNVAGTTGGGVYVGGGSAFTMETGEISHNGHPLTISGTAYGPTAEGGGVYVAYGTFTMNDGLINGNTATYGGGVSINYANVSGTIITGSFIMGDPLGIIAGNPVINGNSATGNGGGVYLGTTNLGGVDYYGSFTTLTATSAEITNNTATGDGGGIYTTDTTNYSNITTAADTVFSGNSASIYYIDASASSYPGIQSSSVSVLGTCALNNYDINYTGASYALVIQAGTGGTVTTGTSGSYIAGAVINLTATPNAGYIFSGWTTSGGGTFSNTSSASTTFTMPAANVTIIAGFTYVGTDTAYHITYDANGGSGNYTGPNIASGGSDIVLPLTTTGITRSGYTFTGWNTAANGSGISYAPGDTLTLNSDVTLYAQWQVTNTVQQTLSGGTAVKTGDSGNITLWISILCVSLIVMTFLCWRVYRKRRHET